jgi:hypothetical protein
MRVTHARLVPVPVGEAPVFPHGGVAWQALMGSETEGSSHPTHSWSSALPEDQWALVGGYPGKL